MPATATAMWQQGCRLGGAARPMMLVEGQLCEPKLSLPSKKRTLARCR